MKNNLNITIDLTKKIDGLNDSKKKVAWATVNSTPDSLILTSNGAYEWEVTKENTLVLGFTEVEYRHEMYRPSYIKVKVLVRRKSLKKDPKDGQAKTVESPAELSDYTYFKNDLLGKQVTLAFENQNIAMNYVVLDCEPQFTAQGGEAGLYVYLHIFSPDKVLALNKYSACYTDKKFAEDVVKSCILDANYDKKFLPFEINLEQLYGKKLKKEYIQPYLVQNDESEYDFISRTANRCGEFFYYAGGKLHFGKNDFSQITEIKSFTSLNMLNHMEGEDNESYHISSYLKDPGYSSSNASPYNGPSVDYFSEFCEKDADFWKTFWGNASKGCQNLTEYGIAKINPLLAKDSLGDMAGTIIADGLIAAKNSMFYEQNAKRSFKTDYIDPIKKQDEHSGMGADGKTLYYSPFANVGSPIQGDFFINIRKKGLESEKETVRVVLTGNDFDNINPLQLGDTVKLNGLADTYLITGIQYLLKFGGLYCEFEAIPVRTTENYCYPAPIKGRESKLASPQIAYVTETKDPCSRGRIRVAYPWQAKKDSTSNATPWIRIATPFSSVKSGIKFMPQKGDEVMVAYENGNIERPYVTGSLQNCVNSESVTDDYTITSPAGHNLTFEDEKDGQKFCKSFFPFMGFYEKVLPASLTKGSGKPFFSMFANAPKELSGRITLSDKFGITKLDLSNFSRNITIRSSLGDIKLDALTGITISAPNGDVKIEGKNVQISAGNKLSITSGENIKKLKYYTDSKSKTDVLTALLRKTKAATAKALEKEALKAIGIVDLKLLRIGIEAIIKPVDGTLGIKSNRYMLLEAGKGTAQLPTNAYDADKNVQKEEQKVIEQVFAHTIAYANNLADSVISPIINREKDFLKSYADYMDSVNKQQSIYHPFLFMNKDNNKLLTPADVAMLFDDIRCIWKDVKENANYDITEGFSKLDNYQIKFGVADLPLTGIKASAIRKMEVLKDKFSQFKEYQNFEIDVDRTFDTNTWIDNNVKANLKDSFKTYLGKILPEAIPKWNEKIKKDVSDIINKISPDDFLVDLTDNHKKKYKRQLFFYVLKSWLTFKNQDGTPYFMFNDKDNFVEKAGNIFLSDKKTVDPPKYKNVNACNDASDWKTMVSCIMPYDPGEAHYTKSALLDHLAAPLISNAWTRKDIEASKWQPTADGQILFSDSKGYTDWLENGVVQKESNTIFKDAIKKLTI